MQTAGPQCIQITLSPQPGLHIGVVQFYLILIDGIRRARPQVVGTYRVIMFTYTDRTFLQHKILQMPYSQIHRLVKARCPLTGPFKLLSVASFIDATRKKLFADSVVGRCCSTASSNDVTMWMSTSLSSFYDTSPGKFRKCNSRTEHCLLMISSTHR